jgi:colicin import membrane protein
MTAGLYPFTVNQNQGRLLMSMMALSALGHLLFLAAMHFAPGLDRSPGPMPGVIDVSLVSLPGPGPGPAPAPEPVSAPAPEPQKQASVPPPEVSTAPPAEEPQPEVSLQPSKEEQFAPKTSLKKKTFEPQKAVQKAIDKLEQEVDASRPTEVQEALERLRRKVSESEARGRVQVQPEQGAGTGGGGMPGGGGGRAVTLLDIYKVEIAFQVQRNWAFSESMAGGAKQLQTLIVFKVMPDGEIKDIRFTRKSGNRLLDESAYKAIVKSNPVDPHPAGLRRAYVEVPLRFTPEGIQ